MASYGVRRIGKRAGTTGTLSKYEEKAKPFEFAFGTIWATSLEQAKKILAKELKKKPLKRKK